MTVLKDGSTAIEATLAKDKLTVRLSASQFKLKNIEQFQKVLNPTVECLEGKLSQQNEEALVIDYVLPKHSETVGAFAKRANELERLKLAQKMLFLWEVEKLLLNPFIHPDNLFLIGDAVCLGHRGLLELAAPFTPTKELFMKQYKALISCILQPQLEYETLIEGLGAVKNTLIEKIHQAKTPQEINRQLAEMITFLREKERREKRLVKKQHYQLFKWGSITLLATTIALGVGLAVYAGQVVPLQERIIEAESKFIFNDYSGAAEELKEDDATELPASAQYILAASYIQLDSLTNEQKEAVLNTLSQKSGENTLLFWVYLGRGEFEQALSLAKNIGDNQYVLHAYTKLYDSTKANTKMDGEKKQELLKEYEEQMNHYVELLGGQTGESNNPQ